jgi:cytoskeletal protein CcmA (bactofilin family)
LPERSVGDRTVEHHRELGGNVWKKDEEQPVRPTVATAPSPEPVRAPAQRSSHATIGPSIVIRGEVSGNEDLVIQGRIDGAVELDLHSVTVGGGGRVKANITGRVITIEGDVEGDLSAEEQIILRGSAKVLGDLKAPRVVLEDGASFRGLVDMGAPPKEVTKAAGSGTGTAPGTPKQSGTAPAPSGKTASPQGGAGPSKDAGSPGGTRPSPERSAKEAERRVGP